MTIEKLGDLRRNLGQGAVVGQFVAEAEVAVGADVDRADGALELQIGEGAALVLFWLTHVEVPLGRVVFRAVLGPGDHELDCDLCLSGTEALNAGILEFVFRLLVQACAVFIAFTGHTVGILLVVARELVEALLRSLLAQIVEVDLVEVLLELVHILLDGQQFAVGPQHLLFQLVAVQSELNGDVQAQVAVLGLFHLGLFGVYRTFGHCRFVHGGMLIDEAHIGLDETADSLHVSVEHEGGKTLGFFVVDHQQVDVGLQRLLAGSGRHAHA